MAPRFKRQRRDSHQSSHPSSLQSQGSHRVRFRRPSLTSQTVPQRNQRRSSQSQAGPRPQAPQEGYAASPARVHHVEDDEDVDEDLEQIVMAIDRHQKGAVGCAYYVAREEKLYCLQDVTNGSSDAIETLKIDVRPTIVLLSPRIDVDDSGSDAARRLRHNSLVGEVGEHPPLPYQIDVRPSQEFSYEAAKTKLINLESMVTSNGGTSFLVPGDASTYEDEQDHENFGSTNRQGKLLRLSSWIDFENRISVGCAGAIITHLQRKRAAGYLPDDPDAEWAFRVRKLEMFTLSNTMFINPDTLLSLQVIQPESHPNAFNQGPGSTGSKESLSVYGLFHHHARTPQGRIRLRQTFLRPSLDLADVNARLDFISVFVRPDNLISLQKLSKSINGGSQKFRGFKSGVWATLLEFSYHTIDIRDTLRELLGAENLPLVAKAVDVLDTRSLQNVGTSIHDTVDLDSSIDQNRTVVKPGVNEQLDETKTIYDGMDGLLTRTAIDIARNLPRHIGEVLTIIYVPQLGYHITLPLDPATGHPIYEGDPDDAAGGGRWERMFTTENQAYLKDARMRAMDERLGDLWNMVSDLEIEISYDLAQRVLQYEETLVAISDICGELDCMFALAQGANEHKLVRPRMTEDSIIDIKDCRHLLQEMTVPSYVTNNAYLVGGRGGGPNSREPSSPTLPSNPSVASSSDGAEAAPTMLLLTGPNYSGKSIYLKSIAQTIYLAHIGSFVPCASALIGITDALLTRIRTCETVSRPHSAFMIDLQQVAGMLKLATRRSLVVIDEFGKGTDGGDGAGLLTGVLKHFLGRQAEAPKVLAATHFHEVFEGGFLREGEPGLTFKHMEVRVDHQRRPITTTTTTGSTTSSTINNTDAAHDPRTEVTYLYNLLPGRSTESYGTQCAAMNGVPAPIVERARQLGRLAAKGEDLVSVCAGVGRVEEQDLQRAEGGARGFLGWDLDDGDGDGDKDGDGEGEGEGVREGQRELDGVRAQLERLLGGEGGEVGVGIGTRTATETRSETGTRTRTRTESVLGS